MGGGEGDHSDSPIARKGWQERFLLKSFIVLMIFPTAFMVFSVLTLPLGLILGVILPQSVLEWVLPVMTYGFGLAGAIWLCRMIWPKSKEEAGGQC